jgi:D-hydroxyproline dehydrogenase subunit beta
MRRSQGLDRVVNLMLTQRPDGSVVLGDTHHYDRTHQPFDDEGIAELCSGKALALGIAPAVLDQLR